MSMSGEGSEALSTLDPRCVAAIASTLQHCWPGSATLNPMGLGLGTTLDRHHAFIATIQELCDRGLLAYEALLIGVSGPEVRDAALTARGRALLQDNALRAAA